MHSIVPWSRAIGKLPTSGEAPSDGHRAGPGDEGGFAPDIDRPEDVLALPVAAIEDAGCTPGRDGVAIALDPAASESRENGRYLVAGEELASDRLIDRYAEMINRFPVWSIEDGLAEDDWEGWIRLTERLGDRAQLMGDDILVTDPAVTTRAVTRKVGNSALRTRRGSSPTRPGIPSASSRADWRAAAADATASPPATAVAVPARDRRLENLPAHDRPRSRTPGVPSRAERDCPHIAGTGRARR
ncbi:hypothetical protein [Streptomyces sp. NPDC014734]|uniref:hypothetical protein n=1 Tax=Streptomyces sp. NPDC014734 TaxID=3364886 RepID=UPI0036FAAD80